MIKPDATEKGYTGGILEMINKAGYRIVAMKMTQLSKEKAGEFYAVHKERPFYGELVEFMSRGPITAAILEKENAVEDFRTLIGATNPANATEGTIRKKYAASVGENAVHGSDSDENAAIEGDFFFSKQRPTTYFINSFSVAVKHEDHWIFYDPGTPFLEPGMLRWQEEGSIALVSDPKEGFFTTTQYSVPARSKRSRRGVFKLLPDGTLEGTVRFTYTGHHARTQKSYYQDMTPAQQEEDWKESIKNRLNTAEISDFSLVQATDSEKPLVVSHSITVPGYATRTGKRILLQPAFFQHNVTPRFTDSSRKFDLYFDFAWSEDDEISIELPDGWELDQPGAPKGTKLGEIGSYSVEVKKTTDGKQLIYHRQFEWGVGNRILVPSKFYSQLKAAFDYVQEQDGYTIALKAAPDAK